MKKLMVPLPLVPISTILFTSCKKENDTLKPIQQQAEEMKLNWSFINKIKAFIFLSFCATMLASPECYSQVASETKTTTEKGSDAKFPSASQFTNSKLTYKIIPAAKKTFCYDIFADGRLVIHQPSAPGLPGNEGFRTKADAEKVARVVIEKLKKGVMPPSVTKEEMVKMKVLY